MSSKPITSIICNLLKNRLKILIMNGYKPKVFTANPHSHHFFLIKYRINDENGLFQYLMLEYVGRDGIYSIYDQKIPIEYNIRDEYVDRKHTQEELEIINSHLDLKYWLESANSLLQSYIKLEESFNLIKKEE